MDYKLVIVESPAKAKTIKKYLGRTFKVEASQGHIRDLPKSQLGVDVEHGFEPHYITIRGRGDILDRIRKEAKGAKRVYLATDPDREGEAISWHLAHVLNIPENEVCRVEFNEITEKTVKAAIKSPRTVNMDLVCAQQARRVLDRLVGYKISPLLWAKVRKGLSAGRVQSAACAMIVDRENEINAFNPQEYMSISADMKAGNAVYRARLAAVDGERINIASETDDRLTNILDTAKAGELAARIPETDFTVAQVKTGTRQYSPVAPFTTSSLQQDASRKLNFATAKTMRIAQQLY